MENTEYIVQIQIELRPMTEEKTKIMIKSKKVDHKLLAKIKGHDFNFSTDYKFNFTVLDQLNVARNFRNRNGNEIHLPDPISRHFKLFSEFDVRQTKTYFLSLDDVLEEIDELRSPESILPDRGLF